MVELTVLGSGSRGNATFIRTANSAILVDAGFSCRQITLRLAEAHWSPDKLDGVIITHEHGDHISGLRVLNRKFPVTVHATEATLQTQEMQNAALPKAETISAGEQFHIGDFEIKPFTVSHDAVDPVGYVIEAEGVKIGFCTDLGQVTSLVRHHTIGCNALVLESNHDREMLIEGPYPWPVKQRIMNRTGHLNNNSAAELLSEIIHNDLKWVFLAHLSKENNTAELAHSSCEDIINNNETRFAPEIFVLEQDKPSKTIRLE